LFKDVELRVYFLLPPSDFILEVVVASTAA